MSATAINPVKTLAQHRAEMSVIIKQKMVNACSQHSVSHNDERWLGILEKLNDWRTNVAG